MFELSEDTKKFLSRLSATLEFKTEHKTYHSDIQEEIEYILSADATKDYTMNSLLGIKDYLAWFYDVKSDPIVEKFRRLYDELLEIIDNEDIFKIYTI